MASSEIPGESPDASGSSLDLERAHAKFWLAEHLAALAAGSEESRSKEGTPLRIRREALRRVSSVRSSASKEAAGGEALCEAAVRRLARRLEW